MFSGVYQIWDECAGTLNANVVLAAQPSDKTYTVFMVGQLVTDLDALDRLFATFDVYL